MPRSSRRPRASSIAREDVRRSGRGFVGAIRHQSPRSSPRPCRTRLTTAGVSAGACRSTILGGRDPAYHYSDGAPAEAAKSGCSINRSHRTKLTAEILQARCHDVEVVVRERCITVRARYICSPHACGGSSSKIPRVSRHHDRWVSRFWRCSNCRPVEGRVGLVGACVLGGQHLVPSHSSIRAQCSEDAAASV